VSCSELALASGLPLAGTATRADRWLLVEHHGPWGRDPVPDTELPPQVGDALEAFDGRVLLVRHPGRVTSSGVVVFRANTTEGGGEMRRIELGRLEEIVSVDLERGGEVMDAPLVLVCTHRRRDACCARHGVPVCNAMRPHVPTEQLWRSSHHGGHRFAANVLALPDGIQLGRVRPGDAERVATALLEHRIPLDHYRGRSLHAPEVQAADAALRRRDGLDRVGDVRLVEHDGRRVVLETLTETVELTVEEVSGAALPASCGAEPEPTTSLRASVVERRS
jgi:hypothetical protein